LNISLFVVFSISIMQHAICCMATVNFIKFTQYHFLPLSNIRLNTNILQSKRKLTFSQIVNGYMYYKETYFATPFYKRDCFHMYNITAANILRQLHVTRINFNSYTILIIGKIALKTKKTIIVML
jgi:hypothetical protein